MELEIVKIPCFDYFVKKHYKTFDNKHGEICSFIGDALWVEECNEERLYSSDIAINSTFENVYDLWKDAGTEKVLVLESIDNESLFKVKCFESPK